MLAKAAEIMDLVPILNLYGSSNLRSLRIDFRVVFGSDYNGPSHSKAVQPLSIKMLPKLQNLALVEVPHIIQQKNIIQNFRLFLDSLSTTMPRYALSFLTLEFSNLALVDIKGSDLLKFLSR